MPNGSRLSHNTPERFAPSRDEHDEIVRRLIAACAGGDLEALMRLLDPDVVGDVELGPDLPARAPLHGRDVVGGGILSFFGPATRTTRDCWRTSARPTGSTPNPRRGTTSS